MTTSSRGLIASMLKIGGAQSINIGISLARMKVLSLLLGPTGVGLLAVYSGLQTTVATAAGLGLGQSGVREIVSAREDEGAFARARMALFAGNLIQGMIAMALVWLLREPIAVLLMGDAARSTEVGLVGIAILGSMIASSQTALLQGLRRIGDLAKVTVVGSLAGTLAGQFAVWMRGEAGLIWFVLVQPLASVLVAWHYTRRLPRPARGSLGVAECFASWRPMARLGTAFMLGGLATTATLLLVRILIVRDLGLIAAGLFAASWGLSMTYVGFLLGAMSADYFPRLTEVIADRAAATKLMNDQAQLGLAIGGPVLLLMIGLSPWLMSLLYARAFMPAAEILQWQTVGNVFKLASWPLGFAIIAAARSRLFFGVELLWNGVFIGLIWIGLPLIGLPITGSAFLSAYAVQFIVLLFIVRRMIGFRWQPLTLWLIGGHMAAAFAMLVLARSWPLAGAVTGILLAAATGLGGVRIVLVKIGPAGRLVELAASLFAAVGWPIRHQA